MKTNKTKALMTLFLIVVQIGWGQVYHKIPIDTNYYWRQFSLCLDDNNQVRRRDYQIRYYNDTIIHGKVYNKYAPFGRFYTNFVCPSYVPIGYLRQDTLAQKVFMLDTNYVEWPLYNFTKNAGDTFLTYNHVLKQAETLTVLSVATATLFDGSLRKVQWTSNHNCLVEGAGSICGGLYGHTQLFVHNVSEQLMCFGIIEPFFELMEGITTQKYVCTFVSPTVGISKNEYSFSPVSVLPNPSNGAFFIKLAGKMDVEYILFDLMGKEVLQGTISAASGTEKIPVNITQLPTGVYNLCVRSSAGNLWHHKVVKH